MSTLWTHVCSHKWPIDRTLGRINIFMAISNKTVQPQDNEVRTLGKWNASRFILRRIISRISRNTQQICSFKENKICPVFHHQPCSFTMVRGRYTLKSLLVYAWKQIDWLMDLWPVHFPAVPDTLFCGGTILLVEAIKEGILPRVW